MLVAITLTVLAGLATTLGAVIATRKWAINRGFTAASLGFAAGAMLFISFTEILDKSRESFMEGASETAAVLLSFSAFFLGILITAVIDKAIPKDINPDQLEGANGTKDHSSLKRSALFIGIAIGLHNFPEGFVTFIGALSDPSLGVLLAVAIAIHNIPEGIAVAAPLFAATKSYKTTIFYTLLIGLTEPLGALIGYTLLQPFLSDALFGWVFGVVAGMMVFIVVDELLPSAKRYETDQHQTTYGLVLGMLVIAISILMLG